VEQRVILSCRANVCAARWAYNNENRGLHKSPEVDIYDTRNGMPEVHVHSLIPTKNSFRRWIDDFQPKAVNKAEKHDLSAK
jgi:hypothetical protein